MTMPQTKQKQGRFNKGISCNWCSAGCIVVAILLLQISCLAFAQRDQSSDKSSNNSRTVIKICTDPDWMPFEGLIQGEHQGIASDYLRLFRSLMTENLQLLATSSWRESMDKLRDGTCEATLLMNRSSERETYLNFSFPYFFGPNVLVTREGHPFLQDIGAIGELKLGLVRGYRLADEINRFHPGTNIVMVDTEVKGLQALENGHIDVYVGSLFSVNARLKQLGLTHLRINGWIAIQDELRVGITKNRPELVASFNKAIEQITTQQHNDIFNRWSNAQIVSEPDYSLLYKIAAALILPLIFLIWAYSLKARASAALQRKNQLLEETRSQLLIANKELEYMSFHDTLTGLYNRRFFITSVTQHIKQLQRQEAGSVIMIIDIDFFKKVNDTYGHAIGDEVLIGLTKAMKLSFREIDIAARWGGEEFIVLLNDVSIEEAEKLAGRFHQVLKNTDFSPVKAVTVSIGIASYQTDSDLDDWVEAADTALYQAKNSGRNCNAIYNKAFHMSDNKRI